MKLNILSLGRCEYEKALMIQYDILKKRQNGQIEDTLILVEHPPVVTLGRHANPFNIRISKKVLMDKGISVFETNRGGDVTYHGPGQIVGYTIVNLRENNLGIKRYVKKLEDVLITMLKNEYNIKAVHHQKHTGVWVDDKKITAIGLAVKRGVTMHGFALNVNTSLNAFNDIVPCGIPDKGVTSIKSILGYDINLIDASKSIEAYYVDTFNYSECKRILWC